VDFSADEGVEKCHPNAKLFYAFLNYCFNLNLLGDIVIELV
jgi:hypothetical protein